MNWYESSDWGEFSALVVTNDDNTLALTADNGRGVATGTVSGAGNDRRIFAWNGFASADMEARLDWELTVGGGQVGLALRVQPGVAVILWNNVLFGATAGLLKGVWEYDGGASLDTNQGGDVPGFTLPVLSAEGDGATVTVRLDRPHLMPMAGLEVHFDGSVGAFGQKLVTAIVDANTFEFADTTAGSWTGGEMRRVTNVGRRKAAARLVGDRVTWKQWLPGEAEPSWADPLRARSELLPAILTGSGGPPPSGVGGVGIVIAHLGSTAAVEVNDFVVTAL